MKLAWLTDVHLNFLKLKFRKKFYQDIIDTGASAILVSGDIAEAPELSDILTEMGQSLGLPIYFVLGNHDYYHGSVAALREEVTALCQDNPLLHWLPKTAAKCLSDGVILIGEDCWADGRFGDYANSDVVLNDSRLIQEFYAGSILGKYQLLDVMQKLADADAARLEENLKVAIEGYSPKKVVMLLHVPPFRESCLYEGKISNDDYLPFFASKVVGEVLLRVASAYPGVEFLALCGHTHSSSYFQPLDNLTVKVGRAEYYRPVVQEVIDI